MRLVRAAAPLVLAAALVACGGIKKVEPPPPAPPKPEEPDRPEERGVPPKEGRPRVPAAPEGLLAEGAVSRIQEALTDRDYLKAHRRGELDAATSDAIRRFQQDEGLAETGFPDRETLRRLRIDPEEAYGRVGDEPR